MKGKKLLCIVLSLAAVCSLLLVRDSVAWLDTQTGTPPTGTFTMGKMSFSFDGELGTYLNYSGGGKDVVPNQNLIVTNGGIISVTNHSSIATEVRFKVSYQYINPSTHQKTTVDPYLSSDTSLFEVVPGSNWVQDTTDGYFYYWSTLPDPNAQTPVAGVRGFTHDPSNRTVSAITNICFKDRSDLVDTDYVPTTPGATIPEFEVRVIFEAKQTDMVTWATISSWSTAA